MMPKSSLRAPWARRLTALAAVSLLTVSACSSDGGGVTGGTNVTVVSIVTIPNLQTLTALVPLTTRQFLGVPTNSAGNFVDKDVTWATSNAAVATVSATGLATAVSGGTAYIRATAGGRTDSVAFLVRFPVGTVTLTPAVVTLNREGTQALTTTTLDTQGATVTGRTVTYLSSTPATATVSATGVVTATATATDGSTTTITATAANALDGGVSVAGTKLVTVTGDARVSTVSITGGIAGSGFRGNSGTQQLTATALSGLGNTIATTINWGSNSAAKATVSGTGLVTFVGDTGSVTITATATGAGAGGSSPSSTSAFRLGVTLVPGVTVNPLTMASGTTRSYAVNAAGLDSFTVAVPGVGGGDLDWAMAAPTVTGYSAIVAAAANFICIGNGTSGNAGSCGRTKANILTGWYVVQLYAWTGGGFVDPVSNETITLTVWP